MRREFSSTVRREALHRAKDRCEVCGARANLELHHIGDRTDRSLFNVHVLCAACHRKEHKRRADRHFGQYR
jgi:hypothetical protein